MHRRLIGIFILLSFLLVRTSSTLAMDVHNVFLDAGHSSIENFEDWAGDTHSPDKPESFPEEENESKHTEMVDEDCLPTELTLTRYLGVSLKIEYATSDCIPEVYFTLPYPPPDFHS